MNLNHPQLDPSVNRVRRVPGSPASYSRPRKDIGQRPVDPENPYYPVHTGLFPGSLTDESGAERPFRLYVPTTFKTSGNTAFILVPGGEKAEAFFEKGRWQDALEKHAVAAFFIEAPQGWKTDDPGLELDIMTKLLTEMRSMEYYPSNAPGVYALGFGDGAQIASVFAFTHCSVLAAWAAWGDTQLDPALLELLRSMPSDCDPCIKKGEVRLPAYLIGKPSNVLDAVKAANHVKDENLHSDIAQIWREDPLPGTLYLNDPACSEVWFTPEDQAEALPFPDVVEAMTAFVESYKRWGGEGNSYIRKTELPEDQGFIPNWATIDGLRRRWWIFEPEAYKRNPDKKIPLVVAIHGFSCSGEFFAENSGWHRVARERGFLLCYPTAYPFPRRNMPAGSPFSGPICPTPAWNSSYPKDPGGPDDVSFFRQMVDKICEQYPVDRERIYVTGHSNGGAMTQMLMREAADLFAAFAPVGSVDGRNGTVTPIPRDGLKRPIWYTMGEFDGTGMHLIEGKPNAMTIRNCCEANGVDYESRRTYDTGIYRHTIVRDENHVPLVRFTGVINWPHTYSPEVAMYIWDDFFARILRHPDGSIEYLG